MAIQWKLVAQKAIPPILNAVAGWWARRRTRRSKKEILAESAYDDTVERQCNDFNDSLADNPIE